jgi:Protein of unknown function (DUF2997)
VANGEEFMAEYQKIEYRIGKDGKIVETVINGSGTNCMNATSDIEQALGEIESRELLPQYYQGDEDGTIDASQTLQQHD